MTDRFWDDATGRPKGCIAPDNCGVIDDLECEREHCTHDVLGRLNRLVDKLEGVYAEQVSTLKAVVDAQAAKIILLESSPSVIARQALLDSVREASERKTRAPRRREPPV